MIEEISVVVCAHDEARWVELQEVVGALASEPVAPREVIVVIDHNHALFERARTTLTGARVVENTQERGLGGARNSGIAASSGSIIAFIDDDAMPSPEWLPMLAEMYQRPDVAGAGGGAEPVWATARPAWFPREFDWVVGCSYLGMPEVTQEVRNLFGCNMSYRRELLDALGGFRLGYGCDETDLCIRLGQRWPEKKLLHVPEAKVFHKVPESRTKLRRFVSRCYFEGGSKAVVSRLVGTGSALSTEYRYTRHILPVGVKRGVGEFIRDGDTDGLARAAAILAGLASTSAGYVAASFSTAKAARRRGWSGEWTGKAFGRRRAAMISGSSQRATER